ncbi:formate dehydrogenase subunit gamma [Noviherbaspirillum sp. 17J57-3]|uniref:Formate dehydrogenase subunit gamma n=1 Tax=Noviherbaspirillum galbum TaxID=2709383 RepID=A0A6B3SH65_9BURK|nr:formate dehydrogenase subunit gamma [Noviherbaspirillum galbum]
MPGWLHLFAAIWLAVALACLARPAGAAVPNESAKPAYAEEQTILQSEKDQPEPGFNSSASGRQHFDRHYLISPGLMPEQDVILQRGGNTWRNLRNGAFSTFAGIVLLVVPFLIFGFYQAVGPARVEQGESGRRITRFTAWERLVHWTTAITFIALALSGIVILFGKKILMSWMGHGAFSWVAIIAKYLHNFVGPLFIVCSIAMFLTFLRRNVFHRIDWEWVKRGGGLASHQHVPAGFFNAGEKVWFWGGVVLLGLLMSVTGLMMDFPYLRDLGNGIGLTRYLLQIADYLHLLAGTMYMAAAMGHIYIGTWGTPGAYDAMRYGTVDENWARAHHELWYHDVMGSHPDVPPMPPADARRI